MKSPFKFLSAYSKEDKGIFFGRDEEIRLLYELVKKNRLVLLYGPSGTGKTSLVSCGLAGKFETTDWFPIKINRAGDINDSLVKSLTSFNHQKPVDPDQFDPVECLEDIYAEYLRPIYLIFDQFEELFVFGSADEHKIFLELLSRILEAQLPCRVMIIMREEYLSRLYQFESRIPAILDRRLRVEPMSREKLLNVIIESCRSFNIKFDEGVKTPEKIIDNLINVRSGMALPYLQVYLDMLYKRDFQNTYHRERVGDELPELIFTLSEISKFGEIENALELYLSEQISSISEKWNQQYPSLTNEFIYQILDVFVSESGTKRPVQYILAHGIKTLSTDLFPGMKTEDLVLINVCLKELEDRRVLLDNEGSLELAHDSLAAQIDKTRSDQQRQINRVRKRLENAFFEFGSSGTVLNREQLLDVDLNHTGLAPYLKPEWMEFIRYSRELVDKTANERIQDAQRKRRNAVVLAIFGFVLALIAMGALLDARIKGKKIEELTAKKTLNWLQSEFIVAYALRADGNYDEAVKILVSAKNIAEAEHLPISNSMEDAIDRWGQLARLVAKGDSLIAQGDLVNAMEAFRSLNTMDSSLFSASKLQEVEIRSDSYNVNLMVGEQLAKRGKHEEAEAKFKDALEAKPNDTLVHSKLYTLNKASLNLSQKGSKGH